MTILQIAKTYKLVPPDGRRCSAKKVEMYRNLSAPSDYDTRRCGAVADLCIDIATTTATGRQRNSRVGFCASHIPRRYVRWFGNRDSPLPKTALLETIRMATQPVEASE